MTERPAPEDPSLFSLAEGVFAEYVRRRDAGEAVDFEAVCAEHPELEDELRGLEADEAAFSALRDGLGLGSWSAVRDDAGATGDDQVEVEQVLSRLERQTPSEWPYTTLRRIGAGSFGTVFEVEDRALRRRLAMKVLKLDAHPTELQRRHLGRFVEEAQVLAQMDHPAIVSLVSMGRTPEGHPFFAMGLVRGRGFGEILELARAGEAGWSTTRALEELVTVCDALAYAHSRGVVHRDVKPANVRVAGFGKTYLLDWGLARVLGRGDAHDIRPRTDASTESLRTDRKSLEEGAPDSPLLTMDGSVIGTPAYMSPEQAEGRIEEVGVAADVYAIGAILYHLLAGHPPYRRKGQRIRNEVYLAMILQGDPTPLAREAPEAPAELVAVCEKAMAREIEERYSSAAELAEDLRAFLERRVVHAYESGPISELRKWVLRNRGLAAGIAGALLLIVGLLTAQVFQQRATIGEAERREAEARLRTAFDAYSRVATTCAYFMEELESNETLRRMAQAVQEDLDRIAPEHRGWEWRHFRIFPRLLGPGFVNGSSPHATEYVVRSGEEFLASDGRRRVRWWSGIRSEESSPLTITLDHDPGRLVEGDSERELRDVLLELPKTEEDRPEGASFLGEGLWPGIDEASGDGYLLTGRGELILWRRALRTPRSVALLRLASDAPVIEERTIENAVLGPGGVVVALDSTGHLYGWTAPWDECSWTRDAAGGSLLSVGDGSRVVLAREDSVELLGTEDGVTIARLEVAGVTASVECGDALFLGRLDGSILEWTPLSGRWKELGNHEKAVRSLDASEELGCLVTCGDDSTVRVWDLESGELRNLIEQWEEPVRVALAAEFQEILVSYVKGSARVFPLDYQSVPVELFKVGYVEAENSGFDVDAARGLTATGYGGEVQVCDLEEDALVCVREVPRPRYRGAGAPYTQVLALSRLHPLVAWARTLSGSLPVTTPPYRHTEGPTMESETGTVRLLDFEQGEWLPPALYFDTGIHDITFSGDETALLVAVEGRGVLSWDLEGDAQPLWSEETFEFTWDPSAGNYVGTVAGGLRRWDRAGKVVARSDCLGAELATSLVLDPGGDRVAVGTDRGVVRILDANTLEVLFEETVHASEVHSMCVLPGENRLISASRARGWIWDLTLGQRLAPLVLPRLGDDPNSIEGVASMGAKHLVVFQYWATYDYVDDLTPERQSAVHRTRSLEIESKRILDELKEPEGLESNTHLARLVAELDVPPETKDFFLRYLRNHPEQHGKVLRERGMELAERSDAVREARRLVAEEPRSTDLLNALGYLLFLEGEYEESIDTYVRSNELEPLPYSDRADLAKALRRMGDAERVRELSHMFPRGTYMRESLKEWL